MVEGIGSMLGQMAFALRQLPADRRSINGR
jgi:hypothetical protein